MTPVSDALRSAVWLPAQMARRRNRLARHCLPSCLVLALALAAASALAQDPCAKFSWDIAHEHALFATPAESLAAGHDVKSAPLLASDRLYELQLGAQSQISMALPSGKNTITKGAFAGLARLRLTQPGTYRVSMDQPAWIDVVAGGKMIDSADAQGRAGCLAPHKIVQYSLPAARELVLQLSAAASAHVRLTITSVEAAPTR